MTNRKSVCRHSEAVVQRFSVKKLFLKISQNSQEDTCARVSFLIKLQAKVCNFPKKETLAQLLSCKFCEIFKNNFLYRTPLVPASTVCSYWGHAIWLNYVLNILTRFCSKVHRGLYSEPSQTPKICKSWSVWRK